MRSTDSYAEGFGTSAEPTGPSHDQRISRIEFLSYFDQQNETILLPDPFINVIFAGLTLFFGLQQLEDSIKLGLVAVLGVHDLCG